MQAPHMASDMPQLVKSACLTAAHELQHQAVTQVGPSLLAEHSTAQQTCCPIRHFLVKASHSCNSCAQRVGLCVPATELLPASALRLVSPLTSGELRQPNGLR